MRLFLLWDIISSRPRDPLLYIFVWSCAILWRRAVKTSWTASAWILLIITSLVSLSSSLFFSMPFVVLPLYSPSSLLFTSVGVWWSTGPLSRIPLCQVGNERRCCWFHFDGYWFLCSRNRHFLPHLYFRRYWSRIRYWLHSWVSHFSLPSFP